MSQQPTRSPRRGYPTIIALLFGLWALVIPIGYSGEMLNVDGDLARHIVLGEHILRHGVVFPDVFSFTKPGEEFVAYEWLSEVILASVHSFGGLAAVSILAGLLIASTVAVIAIYLRGKLETAGILVVGNAAIILTFPHWIPRPHLFSFLALAVLLLFTNLSPGWRRHLGLALLFAFWANVHPGFVYGLAIFSAFLLGDTLDQWSRSRLVGNGLSFASAALGTFLTPLGWRLHLAFLHHMKDSRAFTFVDEFQSIAIVSPYGILFFISLALLIWILSVRNQRPPFSAFLPFLAGLFAALVAVRHVSLFAIFAVPLIIRSTADVVHAWRWRPLEKPRRVMEEDDQVGRTTPYVLVVSLVLCLLGVTSGRVGPLQVVQNHFSAEEFPVEAVDWARSENLDDRRIFTAYHWGGYVLYAWPGQKIYIDGMANFFGSELMVEYLSLLVTQEGWKDTLGKRGIDLLILPPDVPLAREARKLSGWSVWHEDSTAVVLLHQGLPEPLG